MGVNFAVENVQRRQRRQGDGPGRARRKPDGSIFYATTPTYIQTTLLSKPEVGYTALEPVAIVFEDPEVVFTRADSPFKTLGEVIEHAQVATRARRAGARPIPRRSSASPWSACRARSASRRRSCRTKAAAT